MVIKDEIEQAVSDLELSLDRLSALYNQYFIGIEKTEPTIQRTNVDRKIRMLRKMQINNTALRFRLQTQIQKYNTQTTYWRRVCKQIEEGTYERHVMRAKRRQEDRAQLESGLIEESPRRSSNPPPVYELDMDEPFADGNAAGVKAGAPMDALDDPFSDAPPPYQQPEQRRANPKQPMTWKRSSRKPPMRRRPPWRTRGQSQNPEGHGRPRPPRLPNNGTKKTASNKSG